MRACNDNACGESKSQNFHDSLLDLTFLIAALDPKAPIYWHLISRQQLLRLWFLSSDDRSSWACSSFTILYGAVAHVDLRGRIRKSGICHARTSRPPNSQKSQWAIAPENGPPVGRGYMRVRSRGLPRNRRLIGELRWTRRRKTEGIQPCGLMWAALPATPWPHKKGAPRPPPWDGDGPRAPSSDAQYRLPQPYIGGTLTDAMRTTPRGSAGWRWLPSQSLIASPSFLPILLERLKPLLLLSSKATKKRSPTIPSLLWAMADCAFSRQHASSASILASATFDHSAYPNHITGWHIRPRSWHRPSSYL